MIDVVAGTGDEAGGSASLLSGLGAEGGTVSVRTADTAESTGQITFSSGTAPWTLREPLSLKAVRHRLDKAGR